MSIANPMTQPFPGSVWMRWGRIWSKTSIPPNLLSPDKWRGKTTATKKKAAPSCSWPMNRKPGKRTLKVTEQRTVARLGALYARRVLEEHYPTASKVVLVMDNLNTHTPASFYEVFPPEQAKALIDRLEIHYTPKYAGLAQYCRDRAECVGSAGLGSQHRYY
jgi:hypothetical protein